jgi:putative PEP-CTERM system TPR-repeat lipoprotein
VLQPDFAIAAIDLADAYRIEGRLNDARGALDAMLKRVVNSQSVMLARARLEFGDKKPAAGITWLERASQGNPGSLAPRLRLLSAYLAQGQSLKAIDIGREMERIAPKDPRVLSALADALIAGKQPETAIDTLQRVVDLTGGSPGALFRLAQVQAERGKVPAAYGHVRKAFESNPGDPRVQEAVVAFAVKWDMVGATIAFARDLAQQRPQEPGIDALVGALFEAIDKLPEAATEYAAGLAKADNGRLARRLAQVRIKQGQPDAALAGLVDWLGKHPDDTEARLMTALLLTRTKQAQRAIAEYEKVLAATPNDGNVLNNLAWLYQTEGDDRALATAEKAYTLKPQSAVVMDTLGWVLLQNGQNERGRKLLAAANAAGSPTPAMRYHLAVALTESGAREDAVRVLTELIDSNAQFDDRAAARTLMAKIRK